MEILSKKFGDFRSRLDEIFRKIPPPGADGLLSRTGAFWAFTEPPPTGTALRAPAHFPGETPERQLDRSDSGIQSGVCTQRSRGYPSPGIQEREKIERSYFAVAFR
ncbi:hypothetical protein QE152_g39538 [Popillia japonica]|uniref:Uncharacterized protein n=1 Tax=Popillia japonica TaxID=7064 RepID=A0AAW1HUE5_POPJA